MNTQKYNNRITTYSLKTDEILAGSNKVMLDIFNNTLSDSPPMYIVLLGLYIEPKTDVAVTGVVSPRFDLYRSSAIGTGGTLASWKGGVTTAPSINPMLSTAQPNLSLDQHITARSAPSGGATIAEWCDSWFIFSEETNAGSVLTGKINLLPDGNQIEPFVARPGEGFVIKQGSVASLNNYVFKIVFGLSQSRV